MYCRYMLELPRLQLCYIKVGYEGVYFSWTCFPDDSVTLCVISFLFGSGKVLRITEVNGPLIRVKIKLDENEHKVKF